ncbi:class I adenylate-forming enzyme family protein [Nocardia sp. NPDC050175]|uniref:class I adenylate-forming enzyme family protein n=1 Tax=Nocardia sp. NPDC050175 TaxID=3364317 RepID=UPI0037B0E8F3
MPREFDEASGNIDLGNVRVTEPLRGRAQVDPDSVVGVDLHGGVLMAGELDRSADSLAAELDELSGRGLVLLQEPNCLAAIVAVVGVLRSRHALLVVHPEMPIQAADTGIGWPRPIAQIKVHDSGLRVDPEPCGPAGQLWAPPSSRPNLAIALCVPTSGTTGRPRVIAAPHLQVAMAAGLIQCNLGYRNDDVVPVISPLCFDYGLYQLFLAFRSGCTVIVDPQLGTVANVLAAVARAGATILPLVPTMLRAIVNSPFIDRVDRSSIRLVTTTGDVLTEADAQAAAAAFPNAVITPMYGLSECKRVAITPLHAVRPAGAVGRPLPGTDVAILDTGGVHTAFGEAGELVVSGPHLTLGYLADESATARRFVVDRRNGHRVLRTEDRLRMDRQGWLHWAGRSHDLIKTSGYRVDPAEIESAAALSGVVIESGAYGRPDRTRGQTPMLRVRLCAGIQSATGHDTLVRALRALLPAWAIPEIEISSVELPRTLHGKIDRVSLQASNGQCSSDQIDAAEPSVGILVAASTFPRSSNLINCHTQAFLSAYRLPERLADPALFELATTVPFGTRSRPADMNRLLTPWLDPDIGLDRAGETYGFHTEVHWHEDGDPATTELVEWLGTGPVLLGPLDLGWLTYHGLAETLCGCDHYVVAVGCTVRGAIVLIDPEGYTQVEIDRDELVRAWSAEHVPEGRGSFMLRRVHPGRAALEPMSIVARIADAAISNLESASRAVDGGAAAYRTLAALDLAPSGQRALSLLLPAAAVRARLAGRFAGLASTLLPDSNRWRGLSELWNRQVEALALAHGRLLTGESMTNQLRIAADIEDHLTELAVKQKANLT